MKRKITDFLMITLGTLLVTGGVYFFKFPNNFSTGGVSGISIILGKLFDSVSPGTYIMAINISLLITGFLFVGSEFGVKTVYCSLLMSFGTRLLEWICPMSAPFTSQPLLELVFAIFLPGIGSAILFNRGASTGGTDIVAMIIKRIFKTNISKALFMADFVIVMMTFFVFGIETWLFCVLGVAAKVFVMNNVIESMNSSKYLTIITTKGEEIQKYIIDEIHKGATVSKSFHGGFSNEEKSVVLTALTRRQALLVKTYAKELDPQAFIVISTTSDIIGKGFRECI